MTCPSGTVPGLLRSARTGPAPTRLQPAADSPGGESRRGGRAICRHRARIHRNDQRLADGQEPLLHIRIGRTQRRQRHAVFGRDGAERLPLGHQMHERRGGGPGRGGERRARRRKSGRRRNRRFAPGHRRRERPGGFRRGGATGADQDHPTEEAGDLRHGQDYTTLDPAFRAGNKRPPGLGGRLQIRDIYCVGVSGVGGVSIGSTNALSDGTTITDTFGARRMTYS